MKISLSSGLEAKVEALAEAAGVSAQDWVRALLVQATGGLSGTQAVPRRAPSEDQSGTDRDRGNHIKEGLKELSTWNRLVEEHPSLGEANFEVGSAS